MGVVVNPPTSDAADAAVGPLVERLAAALLLRNWTLVTAESCTGGMIAAACTDLAGSSQWFERGLVTYSNQAKSELLGVDAELIKRLGAVSEDVARAMAAGARQRARADVAVAVTGVAGPTGGSADKPVGTVWFGWDVQGDVSSELRHFSGDRAAVRQATLCHALQQLLALVDARAAPATVVS